LREFTAAGGLVDARDVMFVPFIKKY
jgi:hypothetical protein